LPKASVEKFGAIVQPILLNRCGANQCHGPNAKSEFRLLRPPAGQIVTRRFTQRNLYAAVKFLDPTNPEFSPLVMMPQQRHGSALSAMFDKHSANQLAELVAWAKLTTASPSTTPLMVPATIAPLQTTLSQPAAGEPATLTPSPQTAVPPNTSAVGVRLMRPMLDQPSAPTNSSSPRQPAPRDRFDPEIFNQRFHAK
jgi:hypothetical protein